MILCHGQHVTIHAKFLTNYVTPFVRNPSFPFKTTGLSALVCGSPVNDRLESKRRVLFIKKSSQTISMDVADEDVVETCEMILDFVSDEMEKDPHIRDDTETEEKLTCFAEMLAVKDSDIFLGLDWDIVTNVTVRALDLSENASIQDQTLTCVGSLCSSFKKARKAFAKSELPAIIGRRMPSFSRSTASTGTEVVFMLAQKDARVVAEHFDVESVIGNIPKLMRTVHEKSLDLACILVKAGQRVSASTVTVIANMIMSERYLQESAVELFRVVVGQMTGDEIGGDVYQVITHVLNRSTNAKVVEQIISLMREIRKSPVVAGRLVDCDLPYERLLTWNESERRSNGIRLGVLFFLCRMAKVEKVFREAHKLQKDEINESAADVLLRKVQPILEEYVLTDGVGGDLAWLVLGNCMKINPVVSSRLCSRMVEKCGCGHICGHILRAALIVSDKQMFVISGLMEGLEAMTETCTSGLVAWFPEALDRLKQQVLSTTDVKAISREFTSIEEMKATMEKEGCTMWMFLRSGLLEQTIRLIREHDGPIHCDLAPFRDIIRERLSMLRIPHVEDKFRDRSIESFARSTINYTIRADGEQVGTIEESLLSSFVGIEAAVNKKRGVSKKAIMQAFPEMSRGRYKSLSRTEIGLLHRLIKTPGYRRYAFKVGSREYSYLDSLYHAGTQNLESQDSYASSSEHTVVEFIDENIDRPDEKHGKLRVREGSDIGTNMTTILEFAEVIHAADPHLDMTCTAFEKNLQNSYRSMWMNVSGFNPVIPIVTKYPYLFGHEFKRCLLMTTAFDFRTALSFVHTNVLRKDGRYRDRRMVCNCLVRRDHLFEDGCNALKKHCLGNTHIDVEFVGEAGFGAGPTNELFTLMGKEFALRSRNMWRESGLSSDNSVYAFSEKGLFPRPGADPELFYPLGILCGKAILLEIGLPVPFSRVFFQYMSGENVRLTDVDHVLAKSLTFTEGLIGMPFTYPGIDTIELVPNGSEIEVTADNADEYVKLVTDFTCGSKLEDIKSRFNSGFHSVVGYGIWELFTPEEKLIQITGSDIDLTLEDLQKHIRFQHGYSEKSPEIVMLLETIMELDSRSRADFFRFVTGCERLPIGGVSAIHPAIAVAKSVLADTDVADNFLPTASTCTNYLKLPAYTSKNSLKEKLMMAISEGQNAFLLS